MPQTIFYSLPSRAFLLFLVVMHFTARLSPPLDHMRCKLKWKSINHSLRDRTATGNANRSRDRHTHRQESMLLAIVAFASLAFDDKTNRRQSTNGTHVRISVTCVQHHLRTALECALSAVGRLFNALYGCRAVGRLKTHRLIKRVSLCAAWFVGHRIKSSGFETFTSNYSSFTPDARAIRS